MRSPRRSFAARCAALSIAVVTACGVPEARETSDGGPIALRDGAPAVGADAGGALDAGVARCAVDSECADDDASTEDAAACDRDGDGYRDRDCRWPRGDDCDDADRAVHPGAVEVCDNGIDDDCSGARDRADVACSAPNATCATAPPLDTTSGASTTTSGWVISSGDGATTGCGASAFWTLEVETTSDVTVTMRIRDLDLTPPCADCPAVPPPMEITHGLFLERTCGDASSDIGGYGELSCFAWRPFGEPFPTGSREVTRAERRVPAGTYTIEVQATEQAMFDTIARAIEFDLEIRVEPSAAPECSAMVELTDGETVRGTTLGRVDAFGLDCDNHSFVAPEVLHAITLPERRRVRLRGRAPVPEGGTFAPGLRLGVLGACDPEASRIACVEGPSATAECGAPAVLETILEPGRWLVVVESADEHVRTTEYELAYADEPVGAACEGATVIDRSGTISGTTAGAPDHFGWDDAGCGGGTGPDVVVALDVAVRSRVELGLTAGYEGELLRLVAGCGERVVGGRGIDRRIVATLEPGRYHVVIDGAGASSAGPFTLETTIVAI
jgi:hypothetical protein